MSRRSIEHNGASSESESLQDEIAKRERELLQLYQLREAQLRCRQLVTAKPAELQPLREEKERDRSAASDRLLPRELRIQGWPPTTPQSCISTPETVAIPLTGEKRRVVQRFPSSTTVASSQPPPPSEFATRLSRLRRASSTGAAATVQSARGSLLLSPIQQADRNDDISCTDIFYDEVSGFFASTRASTGGSQVSRRSSPRHVRFSSKSPCVAVFSVERPCDDAAASSAPTDGNMGAVSPFVTSDAGDAAVEVMVELRHSNSSENSTATTPSPPRGDCEDSMPAASRISTVLSPRSSVGSYLSLLQQMRSSLLDETPQKKRGKNSGTPAGLLAAAAPTVKDASEDAATPTKEILPKAEPDLEGCVTPFPRSIPANANAPLKASRASVAPQRSRLSASTQRGSRSLHVDEMLSSVLESPAIFLQRPVRQRMSPIPASKHVSSSLYRAPTPERPRTAAGGRRRGEKAARSPSQPEPDIRRDVSRTPVSLRAPSPAPAPKPKKVVHFSSSLGQPEQDPPLQSAGRRRGRPGPSDRPLPVVGTTANAAADMRVEECGFGADIRLPCGPTLFFE